MIKFARLLGTTKSNVAAKAILGIKVATDMYFSRDRISEFAGRLCYNSHDKIATAPNFIADRIRQKHFDILEHCWCSAEFDVVDDDAYRFAYHLMSQNRYLNIVVGDQKIKVSANMRVWVESMPWLEDYMIDDSANYIKFLAPNTFGVDSDGVILSKYGVFGSISMPVKTSDVGALVIPLGASKGADKNDRHATVYISGISRSCATQLVRHRTMSFSQMSQRYVDASAFSFILPESINVIETGRDQEEAKIEAMAHIGKSFEVYEKLRSYGFKKEDARCVLPEATTTSIVVSGDVRAWTHFFELRLAKDAQHEIRTLAAAIRDCCQDFLFD